MAQITVGLDFGTHQTKVCVEYKDGNELGYSFFQFADIDSVQRYTLPSIILVDKQGLLHYGYVPSDAEGKVVRYFKQATFTGIHDTMTAEEAQRYSIWYLAYVLFQLEEKYGTQFFIQMGVPTDGSHLKAQRQLAVRLVASAYRLVEEVFDNDMERFLQTPLEELVKITAILPYSKDLKDDYGVLVFPEAYACLMPLVSSSKIASGMSLMVDIGGGTTDISFFTIKDSKPVMYDFYSIPKGLNFLTTSASRKQRVFDPNVKSSSELDFNRSIELRTNINKKCDYLIKKLQHEFTEQCSLPLYRLMDALRTRPIVYSGGGSTFIQLREKYHGFNDVIPMTEKEWRRDAMVNIQSIGAAGLCPILSTAYGLSISVPDDDISCEPFRDIFKGIRGFKPACGSNYESDSERFDYSLDYDAIK